MVCQRLAQFKANANSGKLTQFILSKASVIQTVNPIDSKEEKRAFQRLSYTCVMGSMMWHVRSRAQNC